VARLTVSLGDGLAADGIARLKASLG